MKRKEPGKTETALQMIKYDFAKNGKDTGIAMNYYVDHKISYAKFQEYAKLGLAVFNGAKQI